MNSTQDDLTQDDIDRTMEDEVRRVRMGAILDLPFESPTSNDGQNAITSLGKTWARAALLAGKEALKTSADAMTKAARLLKHLATSFERAAHTGRA